MRTSFKERGIELQPREGDASLAWRFGWETTRFGRPGALLAVEVARPEPDGFRVTYRRGELDEWYENSSAGLEQGFTVHASPAGEGPLCIAGRLSGQLQAELAPADDAIDLLDDHRARVLRYGELHVWDVAGHEVPARLSLDGEELAILVEDDGAAYPLTVDPLMTTPAWTAESDQASANFGFSVATAGDVNGDGFSDVIVGAELFDNGETNEGRAFVYHGSATGLAASPAWTAESNQAGAGFGRSVATAGDVNGDGFSDVIVGASLYDNGQNDEGRAFVYYGSATGLAANPAWTAESDQSNAFFGAVAPACDANGDGFSDVIIGAPNYDNGQTDEGRAYVYHGSATGLAANPAWTAESNQTSAFFGAVAGAGDVNSDGFSDIIVGARFYANGESQEGRAFVYHGSATGLAASPAWTAESNQVGAQFGLAVATAGDVNGDGFSDVIVGAYLYDNGQTDEGRTFVYHGSATGLAATPAWTAESDQANAFFGARVATAGDVNGDGFADVIIGAPNYDNEGRAFAYQGSASGLATTAAWTAKSNQEVAGFGG
ncbi:MAG TPA: integrin alpha, partial [Solirubrobacterales bacterium]|nr:integrin alpha [Solirubrobacterales bacterium]